MRFAGFLEELRRRKVFQVAAWYGAGAWLLIQVASTLAPEFGLPPWTVRAVVGALLLGFPVALLLAWAFDLTSRGLERTPDHALVPENGPRSALPVVLALAAGALLGVGALQGWRAFEAPGERPGIAVLAFDVMGVESNRPLAGGLHEAVLNELAGISGLRVIARTSVLRFAEQKPDIREVGRILDVPFVLEGSVLRDGDRLRVHAQLIDAATNEHIWSETYDRAADDLFGVQSALARDITARLRVTLLPAEAARAAKRPTDDPAAYAAYLRGASAIAEFLANSGNGGDELAVLRGALVDLDAALARDPGFALAHAGRAEALIALWYHMRRSDPSLGEHREVALQAATEALRLDPELGEAHRALGLYHYWGHFDFAKAEREFQRARALLPNDARTRVYLGYMYRRQGRVDEMLSLLREAILTDPQDSEARGTLVWQAYLTQRYAVAGEMLDELGARFPDDKELIAVSGPIGFCRSGDPKEYLRAAERLGADPRSATMRWVGAWFSGDHRSALAALDLVPEGGSVAIFTAPVARAMSLRMLGDIPAAAAAVADHIRQLEQDAASGEGSPLSAQGELAIAYWSAGRDDDARRALARIPDPLPEGIHPLERASLEQYALLVYAALDDTEHGMKMLRRYQDGLFGHCEAFLRRHPILAPLRTHPDFEAIARAAAWPAAD